MTFLLEGVLSMEAGVVPVAAESSVLRLSGVVGKVVFSSVAKTNREPTMVNESSIVGTRNGYCVLAVRIGSEGDEVIVTGSSAVLGRYAEAGTNISVYGEWVEHEKYGYQFSALLESTNRTFGNDKTC